MHVPLEGQAQVYWRTCRDLRLARDASSILDADAALTEMADLASFTSWVKLRAVCLSHLRCDVTIVGRIGVFVLVLLTVLCLADSAPGLGKLIEPPLARAERDAR